MKTKFFIKLPDKEAIRLFNIRIILLSFLSLLCTMAWADSINNSSGWYKFNHLNPATLALFVKKTGLFAAAKSPTIRQTVLDSVNSNNNKHYSVYTMEPIKLYQHGITAYQTQERVLDGGGFPGFAKGQALIVYGEGLSLGGIFWPKERMRVYGPHVKTVYDNRITFTAIKPVSGHLFPLKVGNVLRFDFKRTHFRQIGKKTQEMKETGEMIYKVVSKSNNFPYAIKHVPGSIYQIQVWEKTRRHPKAYLTDIYQYSQNFHWYISDQYFTKKNKMKAWYRLRTWG